MECLGRRSPGEYRHGLRRRTTRLSATTTPTGARPTPSRRPRPVRMLDSVRNASIGSDASPGRSCVSRRSEQGGSNMSRTSPVIGAKLVRRPQRRRVNLDANEVVKVDPASLVIGKEEKPAKRHRPLEPKPKVIKVETIIFDIDQRMEELYPAYNEYLRLNLALIELRKIK